MSKSKAARGKVEYETVSLNYEALKNLQNSTVRSVFELVNKVILIDGKPFGEATYKDANDEDKPIKLTTGRRSDFLRKIESHAIIEYIGNVKTFSFQLVRKRKC
ncbi:MAG: hypothetical protein FWE27_04340 [Defluviitaleaceae bacterium]|nr:hypothetical protein [Defluviitaleaceae bacterium]